MKKLFGVPHASWFYSLTIVLVVFSLLFSPLAGLGSRALAEGNESAAVQTGAGSEGQGNITNPEPATSPILQIEPDLGNLTEITQIIPNVPPVISGVQVTNITTTWATVVWTTDKPADTMVSYGTSTALGLAISDAGLTTDHSILLSGLEPGTTYYYQVQSTDYSLNTVTDNNGGVYYSFTTPSSDSTQLDSQFLEPQPSEPQKIEPRKATALVSPDKDVEVKSPSEKITLNIPAGAASENLRVDFIEQTPWGSTGMKIVNLFELNAYAVDRADAMVSKFDKELQITIKHSPEDLRGLDTDSLRLYYLDEKAQQWIPVESSKYDRETMILTATIDHFSHYGEQANPVIMGPSTILSSQVNLNSGTATSSYTIEVPPSSGGLQPRIELTYNSGVADEMKNKRSVGSWVGIGWSLDLGHISYDEENDRYYLSLSGQSYELVKIGESGYDSFYRTVPDSFYKITRNGQTWTMYDSDGNCYNFLTGLYHDSGYYYRWNLDVVDGINSNDMRITYVQDNFYWDYQWNVRSAYPQYLRYDYDASGNPHVEIKFNSSYDYNDPTWGPLRNDNPLGTSAYPTKVIENRKLDSIEVRVDGNLARKYVFAYNTTSYYDSGYYGGTYYVAGKHTLTSITEVGADGTSQLPATTFTYTDLPTRLHDTVYSDYLGNPGNPAEFNWPHLTGVSNGYGATVTFAYAEKPSSTADNIWTREVVTTKTINPGIGPTQTYQYTYTGSPQYFQADASAYDRVWNSEYRGFSDVRETDAAGYYTRHYYWTTGSMKAEYLTGREYKTEWYDSSNNLLKKQEYTWDYRYTTNDFVAMPWRSGGYNSGRDMDIGSDGYLYVLSYYAPYKVWVLDELYNVVRSWGSTGSGDGQFYQPQGIAVSNDGYVYVADTANYRIQKFDSYGNFITKWSFTNGSPQDVAVDSDGYVYVAIYGQSILVSKYTSSGSFERDIAWWGVGNSNIQFPEAVDTEGNVYVYVLDSGGFGQNNYCVKKYTTSGSYVYTHWSGDGSFWYAHDIAVDSENCHWVIQDGYGGKVQKFDSSGNFLTSFNTVVGQIETMSLAVHSGDEVEVARYCENQGYVILMYAHPYQVYLSEVKETIGTKISKTRYLYDDYGNVITEYHDGDLDTGNDDATVHRVFYPNTTANILNEPARERVYATITGDVGGANQKSETRYYYDGANSDAQWGTPPTKGDLTRLQQYKDASNWVNSYYTYDTYGNRLTETDPNNNATTYTYGSPYFALPTGKQYPTVGSLTMTESYTWDYGSGKITSDTDVNGQATTYEYDTFKRIIKAVKPGDSSDSPTIQYQYNNWGTINQQQLKTIQKISSSSSIWKSEYFDGVGRVVQTHAQGETGYTIIDATTTYNNRGLVDREYVSQVLASGSVSGYYAPAADWKYRSYYYEGLQRISIDVNADGTYYRYFYDVPWREQARSPYYHYKNYYYDAFGRLVKVEECNTSGAVYSTTTYTYDVLNNLKQTVDNSSNTITMNYDWLSRKTSMSDPDMGSWSYGYDNNSNLTTQTDAKSQTITFTYDVLNRLTGKSGTGLSVSYTYDSTTGGNYGKGQRTGMTDGSGSTTYKYDTRGRLIEEKRTIDAVNYTTLFGYDCADRQTTVTYPTGETVTQTYNGRGLSYTVSGSVAGNIVTSTLYNKLGQYTEINLNNGIKTTFGYWGVGGTYDTSGDYYGRLWEIKSAVGANVRQDTKYVWDAEGNLYSRQDVKFGGTETFTYDFLNRLTQASGPYSTRIYTYNAIGNILTEKIGTNPITNYTYGSSRPHAVTQVGSTTYSYDNNGNMGNRGGTTITWNVENRPTAVGAATFVYDGDGNRVKKTEGGQTTVYIGKYYEKNTSTGVITTYYYLGDKLVALRNGTNLRYIHQDSLGSTSVVTNSSGAQYGYTRYYPYGSTRDSGGSLDTDKKFTGQRLDGTGLYYYGARYYDPVIGKFISPDTLVPDPANPQSFNRYSYVLNNPLKYTDPTGHGWWSIITDIASIVFDVYQLVEHPSWGNAGWLALDVGLTVLPGVPAVAGPMAKGVTKGTEIVKDVDKVIEGVKIGSKTEKIVVKASKGFESFDALKKAIGSASENKEWHHIVEQCQAQAGRAGFDVKLIQNPNNVIAIDKAANEAISGYYSSTKYIFTDGHTVRDWLNGQSFEEQYEFGMQVLKDFGVID